MNCFCNNLGKAIEKGIKSLRKQEAPLCAIEDYIYDMTSGDWIGCDNCENKLDDNDEMI